MKDVLFLGIGASAVAWYRCFLPALFLGADWAGIHGVPPNAQFMTGLVENETKPPDLTRYKIVVIQQPAGRDWLKVIRRLQSQDTKVLFEVDDYLHSIRKQRDHDFASSYGKKHLADVELCMRVCDGLIVSTPFLQRMYRRFNANVYLCENGLDTARYRLTRPPRSTTNIGWAGATGHEDSFLSWLDPVGRAMQQRDETCFVSIGQPFADAFVQAFGEGRAIATPFAQIETYPAAMCLFDIALGPAGKSNFFKGKSDLRWLEAGALGVPIIADPVVYPNIEHGVNGFHASTPEEVEDLLLRLVDDPELRTRVGESARAYVVEERDMRVASRRWRAVFEEIANVD